jgi:hypothetical protein
MRISFFFYYFPLLFLHSCSVTSSFSARVASFFSSIFFLFTTFPLPLLVSCHFSSSLLFVSISFRLDRVSSSVSSFFFSVLISKLHVRSWKDQESFIRKFGLHLSYVSFDSGPRWPYRLSVGRRLLLWACTHAVHGLAICGRVRASPAVATLKHTPTEDRGSCSDCTFR